MAKPLTPWRSNATRLATQQDVLNLYHSGRIDLMLYSPTMHSTIARDYPNLVDDLTPYQALPQVDLYFAFNKAVDNQCIEGFSALLTAPEPP